MGMWSILEEGRDDYGRGFGMRDGGEIEEAYREGCRHGYEKAMNEMRGGMGFRESGNYSGGNGYGKCGGMVNVTIWANAVCRVTSEVSPNG